MRSEKSYVTINNMSKKVIRNYSKPTTLKILLLLLIFFVHQNLSAQQNRIGISGVSQFFLNDEINYFFNTTGGSINLDLGFTKAYGLSTRVQYAYVFPKDENITSAHQISTMLGGWYRIPVYGSLVFFQPSLEAGIVYQSVNFVSGIEMPKSYYPDFIIQLSPALHFVPEKILKSKIDFEVAPFYTIIPMRSNIFQCIGGRFGISYIF